MKNNLEKFLRDPEVVSWFAYAIISFSFILGFTLLFNSILGMNLGVILVTFISFCVSIVTRTIEYILAYKNGVYVSNPRAAGAYICGLLLMSTLVVTVASLYS